MLPGASAKMPIAYYATPGGAPYSAGRRCPDGASTPC